MKTLLSWQCKDYNGNMKTLCAGAKSSQLSRSLLIQKTTMYPATSTHQSVCLSPPTCCTWPSAITFCVCSSDSSAMCIGLGSNAGATRRCDNCATKAAVRHSGSHVLCGGGGGGCDNDGWVRWVRWVRWMRWVRLGGRVGWRVGGWVGGLVEGKRYAVKY